MLDLDGRRDFFPENLYLLSATVKKETDSTSGHFWVDRWQ
jgi:hypothetical protein